MKDQQSHMYTKTRMSNSSVLIGDELSSISSDSPLVDVSSDFATSDNFRFTAGSVLSDSAIIRERSLGNILIEPFNIDQLGNCSYDVTLGEHIYRKSLDAKTINPHSIASSHKYWVLDTPITCDQNDESAGLLIGDRVILLKPGELILGHSQEFIGGIKGITTMMKSRSSIARCGISIVADSGWGDCGFFNRWTLEIQNNTPCDAVLIVGQRVGQVIFLRVEGTETSSYSVKGNYQRLSSPTEVQSKWSSIMMLPQGKRT